MMRLRGQALDAVLLNLTLATAGGTRLALQDLAGSLYSYRPETLNPGDLYSYKAEFKPETQTPGSCLSLPDSARILYS